ncbi:MAG: hypothetical protein H7258_15590 [Ferruginibacter sp.]|nr:hypothetical protein [Ferruginibacter sp.]
MTGNRRSITVTIFLFIILQGLICVGQNAVKIDGVLFNKIDKKNRKQGNWIFFDTAGYVRLTTYYEDDKNTTPLVFFENSDTAFIRFPEKDKAEIFIYYENNIPVEGSFDHVVGGGYAISIDSAYTKNDALLKKIQQYKSVIIRRLYMFGQKKIRDYLSMAFISSDYSFNKQINATLDITASGIVSEVHFPADQNTLPGNEATELNHIYKTMPRWQPLFKGNTTIACRVSISRNFSISNLF